MNVDLLNRLMAAGTPMDLIAEVAAELGRAEADRLVLAERRAKDRERKRPRNSTETAETAEIQSAVSPFDGPPDEKKSNPPLNPPSKLVSAREPTFVLPSDIPEAEWDAFDEARRKGKNRAKWTYRAKQAAVAKLRTLAEDGHPPGEVLTHCLLSGYDGIFAPKDRQNDRTPHRSNNRSGSHRRTAADLLHDIRVAGMGGRGG